MRKNLSLVLFFIAVFAVGLHAQTSGQQSSENKSITFKIPDGHMPIEKWDGFKGVLMLNAKHPAGMFVSYPNDGEKIEDLRVRIAEYIAPMFGLGKEKSKTVNWAVTDIPVHQGDFAGSGKMYYGTHESDAVQLLFYQREWQGLSVIYGHFSSRGKKIDKDTWADEKGQGIKKFEKFWKSFPE